MSQAVPIIYSPRLGPAKISIWGRLAGLGMGAGCLAVLVVAAMLRPSHSGVGTHEALGLAQCQFLHVTGLPCPSCGMTTSFAWFARGNIIASIYVQPMGTMLAILTCAGVWAGLYVGVTGKAAHRMLRRVPWLPIVMALMFLWIGAWAWKIWIHVHGIDGW
jgi:hypothetical protein